MARRRKSSLPRIAIVAAALALIIAGLWQGWQRFDRQRRDSERVTVLREVSADRIDPANEGLHVKVSGELAAKGAARDEQFGVSTNATILLRKVEMWQWQEHCAGVECDYGKTWSAAVIDSHNFRNAQGHENPPPRLANARFAGGELRLGAYTVDPALIEAQLTATDYPVHAAGLPLNLAASFSEHDGMLYAGGDPAQPDVGTLRVSYRIVPTGMVTLEGVQRGAKLMAN